MKASSFVNCQLQHRLHVISAPAIANFSFAPGKFLPQVAHARPCAAAAAAAAAVVFIANLDAAVVTEELKPRIHLNQLRFVTEDTAANELLVVAAATTAINGLLVCVSSSFVTQTVSIRAHNALLTVLPQDLPLKSQPEGHSLA